jgi:hypothetical protein
MDLHLQRNFNYFPFDTSLTRLGPFLQQVQDFTSVTRNVAAASIPIPPLPHRKPINQRRLRTLPIPRTPLLLIISGSSPRARLELMERLPLRH